MISSMDCATEGKYSDSMSSLLHHVPKIRGKRLSHMRAHIFSSDCGNAPNELIEKLICDAFEEELKGQV